MTGSVSFPRAQSASFLISTLNSFWGVLKVNLAEANDSILVELDDDQPSLVSILSTLAK